MLFLGGKAATAVARDDGERIRAARPADWSTWSTVADGDLADGGGDLRTVADGTRWRTAEAGRRRAGEHGRRAGTRAGGEGAPAGTVPVNSTVNSISGTVYGIYRKNYCWDRDDEAVVAVTTRTSAEDRSDQETIPNAALIPI